MAGEKSTLIKVGETVKLTGVSSDSKYYGWAPQLVGNPYIVTAIDYSSYDKKWVDAILSPINDSEISQFGRTITVGKCLLEKLTTELQVIQNLDINFSRKERKIKQINTLFSKFLETGKVATHILVEANDQESWKELHEQGYDVLWQNLQNVSPKWTKIQSNFPFDPKNTLIIFKHSRADMTNFLRFRKDYMEGGY